MPFYSLSRNNYSNMASVYRSIKREIEAKFPQALAILPPPPAKTPKRRSAVKLLENSRDRHFEENSMHYAYAARRLVRHPEFRKMLKALDKSRMFAGGLRELDKRIEQALFSVERFRPRLHQLNSAFVGGEEEYREAHVLLLAEFLSNKRDRAALKKSLIHNVPGYSFTGRYQLSEEHILEELRPSMFVEVGGADASATVEFARRFKKPVLVTDMNRSLLNKGRKRYTGHEGMSYITLKQHNIALKPLTVERGKGPVVFRLANVIQHLNSNARESALKNVKASMQDGDYLVLGVVMPRHRVYAGDESVLLRRKAGKLVALKHFVES